MRFIATADTDIGNTKSTNQDSVLIEHANTPAGEILMAAICDGMGGLSKGEVASAAVVNALKEWFETVLPYELASPNLEVIGRKLSSLLKEYNVKIKRFGGEDEKLGTTCTAILFIGDAYLIVHVGDTRAYAISNRLMQLTEDQTYIQREMKRGAMTKEQARVDPKRNMLLQCVGASPKVEPALYYGKTIPGAYMLCSDGFRHEISEQEIYETLNPARLNNKETMHNNCRYLIDLVKARKERDNISVILVKTM